MDAPTIVWLIVFYAVGAHPTSGVIEKGGATYPSATEEICIDRRNRFMAESKKVEGLSMWVAKDCFPYVGTPKDYALSGTQETVLEEFVKTLEQ